MASAKLPVQPVAMDTFHVKLPSSISFQTSVNGNNNNNLTALTRRQKFKLEPLKILEPSNKKLTLPESQRIMYILDELIRQIEILDYIELITNNDDKMLELIRLNLSDEDKKKNYESVFVSMCQHHRAIVDSYNNGQYQQRSDKNNSFNKETLELLIKSSCKDILRVFHTKPNLFDSVKKEFAHSKVKHPQIDELLGLFNELKDILLERLLISPTEHKEKIEYLKELLLREKANNELIKKLKEEQAQALGEKERDIQTRNDQIRKLDNDLKNVERFSTDLIKRTKLDAEQQDSSETKASDGRKSKLQQELNQLRQHFQNIVVEHREQEQILRKEKWKHETNVEGLLNRYDEDMSKKQNEYDEIETLYEEEKKLLIELEEKLKPLEEEYTKIIEERRIVEQMRRIEQESLNKKIKAAVIIQSYWRGFKLRKGLRKKKGKKGKGKGKGKGKKK